MARRRWWQGLRLLAAGMALVLLAGPAPAAENGLDEGDSLAIRQVITRQLEAFRRDDGVAAFGYASPTIRALFGTPETFMRMVRQGYRPVYRPREVEFRDIIEFRGQPTQQVLVVGPDGVPVIALYEMQRQPDGSWRINGCVLLVSEESTV